MCASRTINRARVAIFNGPSSFAKGTRELLSEPQFLRALCLERYRCERSGHAFLLALLHLQRTSGDQPEGQAPLLLFSECCKVTRTTDVVGWYKEKQSLGLIFGELSQPSNNGWHSSIEGKLAQVLHVVATHTDKSIRITYHVFPEDRQIPGPPDRTFYPNGASGPSRRGRIVKRCLDVILSLLLLIVLAPLLLLIAAAIRLTSAGPAWYRQTRVGEGGRTFTVLKFRSMFHNSDCTLHHDYVTRMIAGDDVRPARGEIYKIVNDPRVTPIGRLLRRSSLDELPQLFNVLKGDMSLVGPRPPLPYEFACYSPWHRRRVLEVKPGLTGLWQVYGRCRTNFDEMVRLDLQYARQRSLWLDLKLLLLTPLAVLSGRGAY